MAGGTLQSEGSDDGRDAVTLATFHAAKGLEWPLVHLVGLEDGLVPIGHARSTSGAEEARLLYVAMTRAADELRCTWAAERVVGGSPTERRLTPWARASRRQRGAPEQPAGPPQLRIRLAEQRALLTEAAPSVSPRLAALQAWRDERARAARVEPATVVDDRLLEMIAEARPVTHDELVAVPGMGPVLAARVGDDLLAALAGAPDRVRLTEHRHHCTRTPRTAWTSASRSASPPPARPSPAPTPRGSCTSRWPGSPSSGRPTC